MPEVKIRSFSSFQQPRYPWGIPEAVGWGTGAGMTGVRGAGARAAGVGVAGKAPARCVPGDVRGGMGQAKHAALSLWCGVVPCSRHYTRVMSRIYLKLFEARNESPTAWLRGKYGRANFSNELVI